MKKKYTRISNIINNEGNLKNVIRTFFLKAYKLLIIVNLNLNFRNFLFHK